MLRPFASFRQSLFVCRCKWFVVDESVRNRTGDGIKQAFEHTDRGGHLVRSKVLDQFVGVLFICRHNRVILHRERDLRVSRDIPADEVRKRLPKWSIARLDTQRALNALAEIAGHIAESTGETLGALLAEF
jgi:hypothetical protein